MLTLKYLPNIFESLPKWRKFAKSGHTEKATRQKKLKKIPFQDERIHPPPPTR